MNGRMALAKQDKGLPEKVLRSLTIICRRPQARGGTSIYCAHARQRHCTSMPLWHSVHENEVVVSLFNVQ